MAKKRVRIVVRGRVQGVNFRAYTKRMADELGIGGVVRNRDDGTVEIVAEGEEELLREIVGWARKGPKNALVTGIETEWGDFAGEFSGFHIEYL